MRGVQILQVARHSGNVRADIDDCTAKERPIPRGSLSRHHWHLSRSVGQGLDQRHEQPTDFNFPENRGQYYHAQATGLQTAATSPHDRSEQQKEIRVPVRRDCAGLQADRVPRYVGEEPENVHQPEHQVSAAAAKIRECRVAEEHHHRAAERQQSLGDGGHTQQRG